MPTFSRYDNRIETRIAKNYRIMLQELSKAQKRAESKILRDILEPAILRRFKKLKEK